MADPVESSRYILADLGVNSNKFWNITRYDDHTVETHYGRVGDDGQRTTKSFGYESAAIRFYESKVTEKTRKGYRPVQTIENGAGAKPKIVANENLRTVAVEQIKYTSPLVKDLVEYLTERNVHNILSATTMSYDSSRGTFSTPLGIVNSSAIYQARQLLSQIGNYVADQDYTDPELPRLVNDYLMLIPQNIGRRRQSPQDLFPGLASIRVQNGILDSLDASLQQVMTAPKSDEPEQPTEQVFDVRLELLEDAKEIDRIRKKYRETLQSRHECAHLDLHKVYVIEIGAMRKAFEEDGARMENVWELWHGSKVGNLLSIMKGGFQIPPSNAPHCTGRMFGNGVYHSDQSTKSLNYAYGYWSGGARDNRCYMFLNNVAMGNYYTPRSYSETLPKPGYDSTFAEGGKSGVLNNEMVVYRVAQVDPVFLVEFTPGGR